DGDHVVVDVPMVPTPGTPGVTAAADDRTERMPAQDDIAVARTATPQGFAAGPAAVAAIDSTAARGLAGTTPVPGVPSLGRTPTPPSVPRTRTPPHGSVGIVADQSVPGLPSLRG